MITLKEGAKEKAYRKIVLRGEIHSPFKILGLPSPSIPRFSGGFNPEYDEEEMDGGENGPWKERGGPEGRTDL